MALLGVGLIAGRAGRPAPPPLIIERHANSPLFNEQSEKFNDNNEEAREAKGSSAADAGQTGLNSSSDSQPAPIEETIYICGARTKKGTPCSRRVHGPVRCWQHTGRRPMLPQEKLAVKE